MPRFEVVGVPEPRAVRVVEPHAALEGAVEAEVARVAVVGDDHPVVARVARGTHRELLAERPDRRGIEGPGRALLAHAVERRPVLRRDAPELPLPRWRERDDECHRPGQGSREDERGRRQAQGERDDQRRRHECGRPDREHLIRAELGDEPEGRHERAEDAPRGRDREQAAGGATEALQRARGEPDRDRRGRREHDAQGAEEDRGREQADRGVARDPTRRSR